MWSAGTEEPNDGRITVVQLGHRVEEMRDETRAAAYRCGGDSRGCDAKKKYSFGTADNGGTKRRGKKYLCPIENTTPCSESGPILSMTPSTSGAAVIIRTQLPSPERFSFP